MQSGTRMVLRQFAAAEARQTSRLCFFFLLSLISNEDRRRKKALSKPKDAEALFKAVHIEELTNNLWAATLRCQIYDSLFTISSTTVPDST